MTLDLIIWRNYEFEDRNMRYIGIGSNTKEYMFRDLNSGNIIFVNQRDIPKINEKYKGGGER